MQTPFPPTRRRGFSLRQREEIDFYVAISLWLIGFILFTGGPILASLIFSFTDWTGVNISKAKWVGLGNFHQLLFNDKLFWIATRNTFYYSFGSVALGTSGALIVAILLNQKLPGSTILRVIYYLPSIASGVAISILWLWLFNPQVGLINYTLSLLGIKGPMWLGSQQWALPALIIKSLWNIGTNMVILLAGLQGIPIPLYEAARIDGASKWDEFHTITIPMLSPVLLFVIVISTIASFQIFTDVRVMTQGGPGTATYVFVYFIYQTAFEYLKMGYSSALAWLLFMIIFILTMFQLWASSRWVYYESGERV